MVTQCSAYEATHRDNFTSHDDDDDVLVKTTNAREAHAYHLFAQHAAAVEGLVPAAASVVPSSSSSSASEDGEFKIHMENLFSNKGTNIAYIDLKIGKWLYNAKDVSSYEEKLSDIAMIAQDDHEYLTRTELKTGKISKLRKMKWYMSKDLIRAENFMIVKYCHNSELIEKYSKYRRTDFDSSTASQLLQDFFKGYEKVKETVCYQIERIKEAIDKESLFNMIALFHSSILICFDLDSKDKCDCRLIDFGRCYPFDKVEEDQFLDQKKSILLALSNIIDCIQNEKKVNKKFTKFHNINLEEVEKEYEAMEKIKENNSVDYFFEKLFSRSSDEVKMAMKKSFLESNGTVLSTDWSEVEKNEVKPYQEKNKKI